MLKSRLAITFCTAMFAFSSQTFLIAAEPAPVPYSTPPTEAAPPVDNGSHHQTAKGAAAGAVAGHFMGHHAIAGALVGGAAGAIKKHHDKKVARKQMKENEKGGR